MEVRGRSRKNKVRVSARRRIRAWMSMVLTAAMMMGNMAASVNTVLASTPAAREEFRIRTAALQKAAEKALDEEKAITEDILIEGKDKSVVKAYQEMFKADGRLYELDILKDIETVKDVDGITLRVFMRLPEEADPKTHVLNGEEELYFLYVNDGDESVSARLNIEGFISGFSTIRPYEAAFGDKDKLLENQDKAEKVEETEETENRETESRADEETGESAEGEEPEKEEGNHSSAGGNGGGSSSGGSSSAGKAESTEKAEEEEGSSSLDNEDLDKAEENNKEDNAAETDGSDASDSEEKAEETKKSEDLEEKKEETGNAGENLDKAEESNLPSSGKNEDDKNEAGNAAEGKDESKTDGAEQGGNQSENNTKEETGTKVESGDRAENKTENKTESGNSKEEGNRTESGRTESGNTSESGSTSGSSDKSSSSDNADSSSSKDSGSDKGSSDNKGTSEDKGSTNADSSVKSEASNHLGISLNQILRVAEPDLAEEEHEEAADKEAEEIEEEVEEEEITEDDVKEADDSAEDEAEEEETQEDEAEVETEEEEEEKEAETKGEMESESKGEVHADEEENEGESSIEDEEIDADYEEEEITFVDDKKIEEEEKDLFEKKGVLEGKIYNLVAVESGLTARVFVTSLKELGMSSEDLTEGGHILTYTVSPVRSAVVVNAPELVRDEAEVTFGVIPQIGYRILTVRVNGEALERVDRENLASNANAAKALDRISNGKKGVEYDEDEVEYFTIPKVLESQEVEIVLVEEAEGTHPAFRESMTMSDGVTITVSAEEGILPEGTYLQVEEVTDKVADAVKENIEAERNTTVNTVIAYDINLMLNGKKLSNSYWSGNYVNVEFSGEKIKEMKEEGSIEIAPLETPTEMVEAALGEYEEEVALDEISPENIRVRTEETIKVQKNSEDSISFQAEHFTIWAAVVVPGEGVKQITFGNVQAQIYEKVAVEDSSGIVLSEELKVRKVMDSGIHFNPEYLEVDCPYGFKEAMTIDGIAALNNPLIWVDEVYYKNGDDVLSIMAFRLAEENGVYKLYAFSMSGKNILFASTNINENNESENFYWVLNKWEPTEEEMGPFPLYYYTLIPKTTTTADDNADKRWNGMGVGEIKAVEGKVLQPARAYNLGTRIDDDIVECILPTEIQCGDGEYRIFPDITDPVDNKVYHYATPGSEEEHTEGYYTIDWSGSKGENSGGLGYVVSNGANSGNNQFNPVISSEINTFHRNGQLILNQETYCTVMFKVKFPENENFQILLDCSERVLKGTSEDAIDQPSEALVPSTQEYQGIPYRVLKWYKDEACTEPADFQGTIEKNVIYYAQYVSNSSGFIVEKILEEGNSDATVSSVEFELYRENEDEKKTLISINVDDQNQYKGRSEIQHLARGTYILQEVKTADGYKLLEKEIKIVVAIEEKDGVAETKYYTVDENGTQTLLETEIVGKEQCYKISVENKRENTGAILPDTGGPGLAMFERFGWFLLMMALLMAGVEVRCYGERKYRRASATQHEEFDEPL